MFWVGLVRWHGGTAAVKVGLDRVEVIGVPQYCYDAAGDAAPCRVGGVGATSPLVVALGVHGLCLSLRVRADSLRGVVIVSYDTCDATS